MREIFLKARRYAKFLCQFAYEKLRGLDFTLPAASEEVCQSTLYNGYTKTPEKHVERLLRSLEAPYAESGFLDIGCGKGAVLRVARRFPFRRVAGVELDRGLAATAQRNMEILGLADVECICGNALEFEQYGEFDVFFLFNPFSCEVLEQVLGKILASVEENPRAITLLYHHPLHYQLMERAGLRRESVLYDKWKGYETYIYSNRWQPDGNCKRVSRLQG